MGGARVGLVAAALAAAAAAACEWQPAPAGVAGVERSDSAGVEIVRSPDTRAPAFLIDSVADLSLGGPAATGPEQFGSVEGVAAAPDGSVWVADRQSGRLEVFEPDGAHRVTLGGRGDGPGEFRAIHLVGPTAGDSVAVADEGTGRLVWYDLEGSLLSDLRIGREEGAMPRVYGVRPDGRIAGVLQRTVAAEDVEPGAILGGEIEFVSWHDPGRPPEVFASAPTTRWLWTGTGSVPLPFTANAALAVGQGLAVTSGPRFELRVFDDGRLTRIARIDREPVAVDQALKAAYTDFVRAAYPEARQDELLAAVDHPSAPDFASAYARLLSDPAGRLWAERWSADRGRPGEWDVFETDGRYLGPVTLPEGLWLHAVTGDAVYGVANDELGVDHVRRHRIRPR